jgi:hypothetical protein
MSDVSTTTTATPPVSAPPQDLPTEQDLVAALQAADALVTKANDADDAFTQAAGTASQAQKALQVAQANQNAAHQAVTDAAVALIAAVKQHFAIT